MPGPTVGPRRPGRQPLANTIDRDVLAALDGRIGWLRAYLVVATVARAGTALALLR